MPDAPKTPQRAVRIDDELWKAAQEKARREGRTVSDVIRDRLRRYVKS